MRQVTRSGHGSAWPKRENCQNIDAWMTVLVKIVTTSITILVENRKSWGSFSGRDLQRACGGGSPAPCPSRRAHSSPLVTLVRDSFRQPPSTRAAPHSRG